MAKFLQKCRDGQTVEIDPESYPDPLTAACALQALVAKHGGPAQPPKPKRYTRRKVAAARGVFAQRLAPPAPQAWPGCAPSTTSIIQERFAQRELELAYLRGQDEELGNVRWFFYMVIAAAKWGEARYRAGGTVLLTFGERGLGAGILVDAMLNAARHAS